MGAVDWDAHAEAVVAKLPRAPGFGARPNGSGVLARIRAVDVQSLSKMQFKAREPLLMPWLHSQDLCMVFAPRGVGKTHFCIAIAYAVSTGGKLPCPTM